MAIETLRKEIDKIDEELLALLIIKIRICQKVKESFSNYSIILFEDSERGLLVSPMPDFLESGLSVCTEIVINNPGKQVNWKRFFVLKLAAKIIELVEFFSKP